MEQEQNRVLTSEEVSAKPEGSFVWLEERHAHYPTGAAMVYEGKLLSEDNSTYTIKPRITSPYFMANSELSWRVWLREPTTDDLSANPWPNEKEDA